MFGLPWRRMHRAGVLTGGGGGAPAPLLLDTFTGTNGALISAHTMNVGPGWTRLQGSDAFQTIESNKAQCINDNPGTIVADAGEADITLTMTVQYVSTGAVGAVFRATDATHYWLLDVGESGAILYENNAGFVVKASNATAYAADTPHIIVITTDADAISATIDGGIPLVFGGATFNQAETKHGIRFGGVALTRLVDTFQVDAGG
jgi:hypothetical protein